MSLKNLSVKTKIPKLFKDKLKNKRISYIFKKFEKSLSINQDFLVAVSGGPDSLALAFLSKIYSIKNRLNAKFIIIDHKLRPESTQEARLIKQVLKKYLIPIEISTWQGKKPVKNIQSIARKKRYDLLSKKCDEYKINNILTGHHQDDLFENFFIRLTRGSGLKGLISLDKIRSIGNKNLYRPLLNQKKEDLVFLSKEVFNFFVNDPSNKEEKFLRIRIRKLLKELEKDGLNKTKFLKTIQNLKRSNLVVDFYFKDNLKKNCLLLSDTKSVLNKKFFEQPYEVTFRGLSEVIKIIGKKENYVRGKKIDQTIKNIENNKLNIATLGGCILKKVNQTVIIIKEN